MANPEADKPIKVTCLEDAWVYRNKNLTHGLVFCDRENPSDYLAHAAPKTKSFSGSPVTIIAAGSNTATIKESVFIGGGHVLNHTENATKFTTWFEKRLGTFAERGEQHIVVVDNAVCHPTQTALPLEEKEDVLRQWLLDLKSEPGLTIPDDINQMRIEDLRECIVQIKSSPTFFQEIIDIDTLAAARGHTVLRLSKFPDIFNFFDKCWHHVRLILAKPLAESTNDIENVTEEILKLYDESLWKKHWEHAHELIATNKITDNKEIRVNPLIIPLFDDDDTTTEESSEEETAEGAACGKMDDLTLEFNRLEIQEDLRRGREEVARFHAAQAAMKTPVVPKFASPGDSRKRKGNDREDSE